MDFTLPAEIEQLRLKVRHFVESEVMPLEADKSRFDDHENLLESVVAELRRKAKAQGLWGFQLPKNRGGLDLGVVGMAALYEEAARSPFGPVAFNCAPPDDGNMIVLNKILKTEALKDRWLQPIIDGKVRSAFAMTEPDGGCGSDPGLTYTRAEKVGDKWIVNGRKWFITGAEGAQTFILIAKTSDDERKGLTAFLFDKDQPGWEIIRRIPIMGPEEHGGHCELRFDGLEIPDENRLLEVGEVAAQYVENRMSFGSTLSQHEGVQWMMGEVAKEIHIGRLLTMNAAWKLDQGDFARKEISIAKIQVADTLHKAADTAIQLCGARGYSKDTMIEWIYRYARQARLVDGASEIHKMVLSKYYLSEKDEFFKWGT